MTAVPGFGGFGDDSREEVCSGNYNNDIAKFSNDCGSPRRDFNDVMDFERIEINAMLYSIHDTSCKVAS